MARALAWSWSLAEGAGGAGVGYVGGFVAAEEGAFGGEGDVHVGHEAGDDDGVVACGVDQVAEVGAYEGIGDGFDYYFFVGGRGEFGVDSADFGGDVVGGVFAAVVDDVDDCCAGFSCLAEQFGGGVEGGDQSVSSMMPWV